MKISCSKDSLANAVAMVSKAVPSKTAMSIFQCVLIVAENGEIKLMSNNTELGIRTFVEGEIRENGIIAVDAKIFENIVRHLPEGEVAIESSDCKASIKCASSRFNLPGRSGDDFPYIPEIEEDDSIEVSQLKEVIGQTIFSASTSETNKMMMGILFELREGRIRVAALDGHRIAVRSIAVKTPSSRNLVIPGRTLVEISKILSGEKAVRISYNDKNIIFEFDQTLVYSRLMEGDYFNIDQMISGGYETMVTISRKSLIDMIERAIPLVREGDKKPIILNITDGELEMGIKTAMGSMDESIAVKKTGSDLKIGFNPRFILDALRAIEDEDVTMYLTNAKSPCYIRDNDKYNYVILPVNFAG